MCHIAAEERQGGQGGVWHKKIVSKVCKHVLSIKKKTVIFFSFKKTKRGTVDELTLSVYIHTSEI